MTDKEEFDLYYVAANNFFHTASAALRESKNPFFSQEKRAKYHAMHTRMRETGLSLLDGAGGVLARIKASRLLEKESA